MLSRLPVPNQPTTPFSPRWVKKQIHGIEPAMNFTNDERRFIT
jgi:hypothetical protein